MKDAKYISKVTGVKNVCFQCDRNMPIDYWEVEAFHGGKRYVVYSEGA